MYDPEKNCGFALDSIQGRQVIDKKGKWESSGARGQEKNTASEGQGLQGSMNNDGK